MRLAEAGVWDALLTAYLEERVHHQAEAQLTTYDDVTRDATDTEHLYRRTAALIQNKNQQAAK